MSTSEITQPLQSTEPLFLTLIRLRAQRRILWLRNVWSAALTEEVQGLAISHNEVDMILAGTQQYSKDEADFYETDADAGPLSRRIRTLEMWLANDGRWMKLQKAFDLSLAEMQFLMLAVAVEIDPLLRRVYGYLQDDATAGAPTLWLAASLFQWFQPLHFGSNTSLVRWHMAWPVEGLHTWSVTTPWVADAHIVSWLTQQDGQDPRLGRAVECITSSMERERLCLYPAELTELHAFLQAVQGEEALAVEIELIGPAGVGKRTLAKQFCAQLEQNMVVADAALLLSADISLAVQIERATRAVRIARLNDAVLYWQNAQVVESTVWQMVNRLSELVIFGVPSPLPEPKRSDIVRKSLHLPVLTQALRIELWEQLVGTPAPQQIVEWKLTAGEIVSAVHLAVLGDEAVAEACKPILSSQQESLFTLLPCPFVWDDIVLAPHVRQQLAELEDYARLRWVVYEEWGFERLFALGRGVTALFAGPSGTGKTMAVQVVARSLGMDLYRVDLANVMSKYIGETEKRLKIIFDTCERANVLLFFDEADALFGQRTQVKDAHDRFANIEIDYLLQRMEQFDGIAILATNRKMDMDSAFLRRLRFIIDFLQPDVAERLALWHLALLERTPKGEPLLDNIDWNYLATKMTMTGADIKAAALGAAFLAYAAGTRITMKHVLHAAQREMTKQGVVLRVSDWQDKEE